MESPPEFWLFLRLYIICLVWSDLMTKKIYILCNFNSFLTEVVFFCKVASLYSILAITSCQEVAYFVILVAMMAFIHFEKK